MFGIHASCDINILVYDKGEFKRKINIPQKEEEEIPECFYKTLGIPKPQDNDLDLNKKIKYAFHRKALETHPDKGGDPADFMKVLNAYEALYDDEKRNIYNNFGYKGLKKFERGQKMNMSRPCGVNAGLTELNKMKGENKECEDDEARTYLKYIIDHYDNLPYYTFFIHSEMYSPYHTGSILDKFNEAVLTKKLFYNINDKKKLQSIVSNPLYDEILEWYDKYIEKYIPINNLPSKDWTVNYRGSAQF